MTIGGIQKMTLLDYPGKVACIVFTAGCNYRCPFCHNSQLVINPEIRMEEQEFFGYLDKRKNMLEGVCITGGEPLIHQDIEDFIKKIRQRELSIKLDTNGSSPDYLKLLCGQGLIDYVAMDIKNSPNKYSRTCGVKVDMDKITESIDYLIHGRVDYEFRTTVMNELHTCEDIRRIGELINGGKRHYIQPYKATDSVIAIMEKGEADPFTSPSASQLESYRMIMSEYVTQAEIRG